MGGLSSGGEGEEESGEEGIGPEEESSPLFRGGSINGRSRKRRKTESEIAREIENGVEVNLVDVDPPELDQGMNSGMRRRPRPMRIFLVRHGQSEGNVDESVYTRVADSRVALTEVGIREAEECGEKIRRMIEEDGGEDWKVYFYVSPYRRTLETLRGVGRAFERDRILGVREEPRIREQDFGNFQVQEKMRIIKHLRLRFGKFFFRFPEGESAADVYDRVSGFLDSFWRDIEWGRLHSLCNKQKAELQSANSVNACEQSSLRADRSFPESGADGKAPEQQINIVMVIHGLTMRVFLMRWFRWTVEQFESLTNPTNCEVRVMDLGQGGRYSLALHHSKEEMAKWGLSDSMIQDQCERGNSDTHAQGFNDESYESFFGVPQKPAEENETELCTRNNYGICLQEDVHDTPI